VSLLAAMGGRMPHTTVHGLVQPAAQERSTWPRAHPAAANTTRRCCRRSTTCPPTASASCCPVWSCRTRGSRGRCVWPRCRLSCRPARCTPCHPQVRAGWVCVPCAVCLLLSVVAPWRA
jgi:hypothetical protein